MNAETIKEIKKSMDYSDGNDCCKTCKHFDPNNGMSGRHDCHRDRCARNAFYFNVSENGRCNHWEAR